MKTIYQLDLGVMWANAQGSPTSEAQGLPDWTHCANNLEILADFIYSIISKTPDWYQQKVRILKVTRFIASNERKKKVNGGYGKDFYGWSFSVDFRKEDLKNINSQKIEKKNEKKFKKNLLTFWKLAFKDIDKKLNQITVK